MRIKPTRSIVATSLAALLLAGGLAACGDDDEEIAAPDTDSAPADPGSDSDSGDSDAALTPVSTGNPFEDARTAASHMPMTAAALAGGIAQATEMEGDAASDMATTRATLTHLLTEHVYLAGIAVATAYATSPDSPEFELAAATVDENSVAVAEVVGSVAPDDKEAFLDSWRGHVGDFVTYAVGAVTEGAEGKAMKDEAVANLTAYAESQGAFFEKISGGALPAADIEAAFNEHIGLLATAVDGFAAGDAKAYTQLQKAASHMPMMAKALTTGIAEATEAEADPNDASSELRSGLTGLLTDHVYLAGIGVFTAYTAEGGADSDAFKGAGKAIQANSDAIIGAVGGIVQDKDLEKTFADGWNAHVGDFVAYAVAAAGDDEAGKEEALANLDAYRTSVSEFFSTVTAGVLPVDAVKDEFTMHIESTAGAIDSLKAALVK